MKKILIILALLFPLATSAITTVPWQQTNLTDGFIFPSLVNGNKQGIVVSASSSLQNLTFTQATGTSATTTNLFTSSFYATGLTTCNTANSALLWAGGIFGCTTISGSSGTVSTSSSETAGRIPFWTSTNGTPALLSGGSSAFTFDNLLSKLTVTSASTTNLSIGALSGILKQAGGVVTTAIPGTDYLVTAITSLNGLTGASQTFATTSSNGGWGFASSGTTHTLNIPTASATNPLGLLSSTDWSTFNGKQAAGNYITSVSVVTANGVSGTSSGGSTPALTFSLGAITPSTVNGVSVSQGTGATTDQNIAIGNLALSGSNSGTGGNVAVGSLALQNNTTGFRNSGFGTQTLQSNVGGIYNTAIGYDALGLNVSGNTNAALGAFEGRYELGSNAFYLNNINQTNTAGDKAYSLLYGNFSGTAGSLVNQQLTINAASTTLNSTLLVNSSTTLQNFTATNSTTTNATSTSLFSTTGLFTSLYTSLGIPAGTFVAADQTGKLIATSTPIATNYWTLSGGNIFNNSGTNVGIGTSTPAYTLTVANSSGQQLGLTDGSLTSNQWAFRNAGGTLYIGTSSPSIFATSSPSSLALTSASITTVGIATTSPWRTLSVTGTVGFDGLTVSSGSLSALCLNGNKEVTVNTSTSNCSVSARRYKKDISPSDLGLQDLMKIQPVTFTLKSDDTKKIGFIADDLAGIDKRLGEYQDDGEIQSFDEIGVLSITVKAVQELASQKSLVAARSVEENWQWFAIAILVVWNVYLTAKRRR